MNSSACYRNGTQNGDGDDIGQCEHTITQKQTSIVKRSIERFYKPVRPVPQTWSPHFAELSSFLLYSTMRVLPPEAKKYLSIVEKSIHMHALF